MSNFFIYIYNLLHNKRWMTLLLFAAILLFIVPGILKIRFVEDISGSSTKADKTHLFDYVVTHVRFTEKLIISLSVADTSTGAGEDSLCMQADYLTAAIDSCCQGYFSKLTCKADDSLFESLVSGTRDNLPLFLDERDYYGLDTLTSAVNIERMIRSDYRKLLSPASFAIIGQVLNDPVGIQGMAVGKLHALQGNDEYESYNGYVVSRDHRHLLIFLTPQYPPGETGKNGELLKRLDEIMALKINQGRVFRAEYFGAAAVAVGNANRLKKDILLTLAIAMLAIFVLLGFYFRSALVPLLGLLPAAFGGGLALAVLAYTKGSVSAIALGIGSVILGLIIDYSLYLINHYRRCADIKQTLGEMSQSIVVCALTSAGAFLCLIFLESSVLHDLGWFAAISVSGAALFALLLLPQLLSERFSRIRSTATSNFIDRLGSIAYEKNAALLVLLGLLTFTSIFFYRKAGFETDMNTLNYMEPPLRKAGETLDSISSGKFKNIYIVATGSDLEKALRLNEKVQVQLNRLIQNKQVSNVSGIRTLLFSDSLTDLRLKRWESFFTADRSKKITGAIGIAANKTGFRPGAFDGFGIVLQKKYTAPGEKYKAGLVNALFSEFINDQPGLSMISSIARVSPGNIDKVYQAFRNQPGVVIFDRQKLTTQFVSRVRQDFDRLVLLSMLFVSLLLWISFGRIEIALFTAVPMYLSWLITLGFMGATGIRFNIFNIIISSFIFGLGVDYSILMMRGIMQDYKYQTFNISSYRVSIILSSATTLFGVAALFTAKHPALNSIALISVFGILVLVVISFSIQPLLTGWFITSRLKRNKFPITARIFIKTMITWFNIVFIAFILAVLGSLLYFLLPVKRSWKENLFHRMFCSLSKFYIFITFSDKKLYNPYYEDFSKPAVIISNHQSLIETPAMLRLYPRIIILTTTWVYNSPVFGPIARLSSFYNVDNGLDSIMDKLRVKVSEGYSILIFPEAHRSSDHRIQRFHRGAFYLAEQLRIDILPVMMFGSGDFLPKGAFWGRPNSFRQKIFKRISFDDKSYGTDSREKTKAIRQFFIREYERFTADEGSASYYRRKLCLNYVYKGPVLEWYTKIKLRLEKNYQLMAGIVPRQGSILDLGCGYGIMSHMLALTSPAREICGIDYDEEKIKVASSGFLNSPRLHFEAADIRSYNITPHDCIILSDVLHYLPGKEQEILLLKCMGNINPGGFIIIRDADSNRETGHSRSRLTELFSTGMRFNKTYDESLSLHFLSTGEVERIAGMAGFVTEILDSKTYSSNTYYRLKKQQDS
jgi:uncharacterized protein